MAFEARLFREGTEEVSVVDPVSDVGTVPDHSLLWVDMTFDDANASQLEGLGLAAAARELIESGARDITFHRDTIRLSVTGLQHENDRLAPVRLALLLARNVVVSMHDAPVDGLDIPINVMAHDPRFGRLDAGRFSGLLLEGVLEGYDDVVERLGREIDELDERALQNEEGRDLLEAIVDVRRRIAVLRRALARQRPVFVALGTVVEDDPSPVGIPDDSLLAHLDRTIDAVERLREQLIGSFDILMTRAGQRTNDIVRVLTIVSAVLLPAGVIAGIMGMNFEPAFFDEPDLFFLVVAVMAFLAIGTLIVARQRRWI